jgi:hypothetical protein
MKLCMVNVREALPDAWQYTWVVYLLIGVRICPAR